MFDVGLSKTPVVRDGLTSHRSYVILACKSHGTYNCVVWGVHTRKLKFYPNAEFWGVSQGVLDKCELYGSLYSRSDYQGMLSVSSDKLKPLLKYLAGQRGASVVSPEVFAEWAKTREPLDKTTHPATFRVPAIGAFPKWSGLRANA